MLITPLCFSDSLSHLFLCFLCAPSSHLWSLLFFVSSFFLSSSVFCSRVSLWVIWITDDPLFLSLSRCIIDQSNLSRLNLMAEAHTQSGLNRLPSSQPWFLLDKTINWGKKCERFSVYTVQFYTAPPFHVCSCVCICTTFSKIYTYSWSIIQHQITSRFASHVFCRGENQFHCPWLQSNGWQCFLFEGTISSTLLWH